MMDLDKEIERALSEEDIALAQQFEELGLIGQFKSVFQGKMGWVSVASMIAGTILNFLFLYAAWKFFTLPATEDKVFWGGIAWFSAIMVAFMKVWFWMRMESNRVIREIKRLELQVARLQLSRDKA